MAKTLTETQASSLLKTAARKAGAHLFKIVANPDQESGIPDLLGIANSGRSLMIETKLVRTENTGMKYEAKQRHWLTHYAEKGGIAVGVAYCNQTQRWGIDYDISRYPQEWFNTPEAVIARLHTER